MPRIVDLSGLSVVDGHCHPLVASPWDVSAEAFSNLFSEGRPGTMAAHIPHTGYFRRALRDLARLLGSEPDIEAVLERRRQIGPEVARRGLAESHVSALLVDTGYPPGAMSLSKMHEALPCAIHEVFRIESCAQNLLPKGFSYDEFVKTFRDELTAAARSVVAFKSIVAYRSGLAIQPWKPEEAARAYREAVTRVQGGGSSRLTEKPLLDTLVALALDLCRETGRPLQLHAGFGDPDIDLLQANPVLLRSVLEDPRWADVRIVVLHMAYPYVREAAFMASVWPQLHVDLSLALPFLGRGAVPALAEMLALAPASKLLYGSDLGGLPELYMLSANWGRATLGGALGWLVERDEITAREGREMGRRILSENAISLYGLEA